MSANLPPLDDPNILREQLAEYSDVFYQSQPYFFTYDPHRDHQVEQGEREFLRAQKGFENTTRDYKLHLNPRSERLAETATHLVDLCRESPRLRGALFSLKVWAGGDQEECDEVPRIVIYPRGGLIVPTMHIIQSVVPYMREDGIAADDIREPRYNFKLADGVFMAQGSGQDKVDSAEYRSMFSPETNYSMVKTNNPAGQAIPEETRSFAQSL